jgi:glycosyltransferase involved in cell wall biosynthesis
MEAEKKVSVIIPLFNEETGIGKVLEKIVELGYHEKYEVIVVNDGSTDNSLEVIKKYPVNVYSHTVNKGYGAALKTGIRKSTGDYVVMLDSDGQHDPSHIPTIVEMLHDHDMVIGTRDKDSYQVKTRQAGKRVIRIVGEYLVEQKLPDYNSGFRGFHKDLLSQLIHIFPNGFSFSTTSTLAFLKEGYNIGTFPITVEKRVGRVSNVKFLKDGPKTIMLILRIIMLFNPLKIFLPASVIIFFAGVAFGVIGYFIAGRFPNSALIITILAFFLFFIGLVADQVSILTRKKG